MLVHLFQELQVLPSEAQSEKVTSDLPDDPAIIQVLSTLCSDLMLEMETSHYS